MTTETNEPTEQPTLYDHLAKEFEHTFTDVRGGVQLEYITGEQAVTRLNRVLGFEHWSFAVKEHGFNVEADEIWVLGELTVTGLSEVPVIRQQFGSQKLKRSRSSGQPLDIGFDFKGATTDALKKCASLIGVGLWLSHKEEQNQGNASAASGARTRAAAPAGAAPSTGREPMPQSAAIAGGRYDCEDCGAELKECRFKDGTVWAPSQLAAYAQRKHGKTLCMDHYRVANEMRKSQLLTA